MSQNTEHTSDSKLDGEASEYAYRYEGESFELNHNNNTFYPSVTTEVIYNLKRTFLVLYIEFALMDENIRATFLHVYMQPIYVLIECTCV